MEKQESLYDAAYEWAFAVWASESPGEETPAHLPTSLLYDWLHQQLAASEQERAALHLDACATCAQALQAMREAIAGCSVLPEQVPLAAQSAAPSQQYQSLTPTAGNKIKILEARHGEGTLLWLDVEQAYLREFENKSIRVFDAHHEEICRGRVVSGRVSWRLPGKIAHPLRLVVEPEA